MKSVTIRDKQGKILVKVIHRKSGEYEVTQDEHTYQTVDIDVRDDKGCKVMFGRET